MIPFIIITAAMVLAVAALIGVPLLSRRGEGPQATWTVFAVLGVLLLGGAALYDRFSNWNWTQASQAPEDSPQSMVSKLARRLARHPDDLNGWLLLGHSYSVLEETPLAIRAYERANLLAQGRNVDALMGLAEALITQDGSQLDGRAGGLIEQALQLAPRHPKALFYGAAAAIGRHDFQLARTRFAALLDLNPPPNVRNIIEQQIAALDQRLAGGNQPAAAQPGAAAPAAGGAAPVADGARVQDAVLRVTVTLSPKLKLDTGDASLFVFVRDPRQAGPPLAVKRLSAHFPQTVELSSADAMITGHGMTPGQDVEVVARIARGGGPTAQAGDPFGAVAWHVDHRGAVTVVIDRQAP